MPGHYYFVEKLKIVEKQLCKLNCSYGKVSHALKVIFGRKIFFAKVFQISPFFLSFLYFI